MILAFSTHFPKDKGSLSGKETFFAHKIYASFFKDGLTAIDWELTESKLDTFLDFIGMEKKITDFTPKRHSIRRDMFNRWKPGRNIQPAVGVRTKNYFQFAPTMLCVSIQAIEIVWSKENNYDVSVFIDGKKCSFETVCELAKNDGFELETDFFEYFNEDFTGRIIHWTNLKY